jgi:hypothetical protein
LCPAPAAASAREGFARRAFFVNLHQGWRNPFQATARTTESPEYLHICLSFLALLFPSGLFSCFFLEEKSPPPCQRIASLRKYTLNDLVDVNPYGSHPFQCILLQLCRKSGWLRQFQDRLLVGCMFTQKRICEDVREAGSV